MVEMLETLAVLSLKPITCVSIEDSFRMIKNLQSNSALNSNFLTHLVGREELIDDKA